MGPDEYTGMAGGSTRGSWAENTQGKEWTAEYYKIKHETRPKVTYIRAVFQIRQNSHHEYTPLLPATGVSIHKQDQKTEQVSEAVKRKENSNLCRHKIMSSESLRSVSCQVIVLVGWGFIKTPTDLCGKVVTYYYTLQSMPTTASSLWPLMPFGISSKLQLTKSAVCWKACGHMSRVLHKTYKVLPCKSRCMTGEEVEKPGFHRCKVSSESIHS